MLFFALDIIFYVSNLFVAPVLSLFTKAQVDLDEKTERWGWLYGTWDNPPQGDTKHQREGLFPYATTGVKGYIMRVLWLYRNPAYGFQKAVGIPYNKRGIIHCVGDEDISDKYGRPGYYYATYKLDDKLEAFEFYAVLPYTKTRCLRIRLGWKLMTDKFERYGFATYVDTITPFKRYNQG